MSSTRMHSFVRRKAKDTSTMRHSDLLLHLTKLSGFSKELIPRCEPHLLSTLTFRKQRLNIVVFINFQPILI